MGYKNTNNTAANLPDWFDTDVTERDVPAGLDYLPGAQLANLESDLLSLVLQAENNLLPVSRAMAGLRRHRYTARPESGRRWSFRGGFHPHHLAEVALWLGFTVKRQGATCYITVL